jgi:hypothetical protein
LGDGTKAFVPERARRPREPGIHLGGRIACQAHGQAGLQVSE